MAQLYQAAEWKKYQHKYEEMGGPNWRQARGQRIPRAAPYLRMSYQSRRQTVTGHLVGSLALTTGK